MMHLKPLLLCFVASFYVAFNSLAQEANGEQTGLAIQAGEISIVNEESPVAANFGILPPEAHPESYSWAHSSPEGLRTLLLQFQHPLVWQAQRLVAVNAISAPVLPDAEGNVPPNWLLLRLEALYRMGEYEGAWKLFNALNSALLTEPVARMGANLGWATHRSKRACALTAAITENEATAFEGKDSRLYWLVHYMICQRLAGKQAEAELSLDLLTETVPKQLPPLLGPLIQDWGRQTALPPLSARDALIYPVLSNLLLSPLKEGTPLTERIPAHFVALEQIKDLPPELQAGLSRATKLPALWRASMAETAVRYHLLDGAELGRFYKIVAQKTTHPKEPALQATYARALLFADIESARTPQNRLQALSLALQEYRRLFSAHDARAILGAPLRQLSAETQNLGVPLAFETLALYLDRGDLDEAQRIARTLNERDDPTSELATGIAGRILAMKSADQRNVADAITLPEFTQSPEASTIWLAMRYARVMEAEGFHVTKPATLEDTNATPPEITYASPTALGELQMARGNSGAAEQLLRSVLVLDQTPPQRTSDQALLQVLETWNERGLRKEGEALIVEALLGIPDAREP